MLEDFSFLITIDDDHERFFLEMYYKDQFFAILDEEKKIDCFEIHLYVSQENPISFNFDEFQTFLGKMKKRLTEFKVERE